VTIKNCLDMPIATRNFQYAYVPETKEDLDWADLPTVDLSKFDNEEGKQELAKVLLEAVNTKGFFYLINFGISSERVSRQFGIGSEFYGTPIEERMKSKSDLDHGNSNGYSPMGNREVGKGLKDRKEEYNVPIHDDPRLTHPAIIQEALPEIKEFEQDLHTKVLARLYELIAIGLEIPPESLKQIHDYQAGACGILRYMRYSPYTAEEIPLLNNGLYAPGHTDSCAITLLFRQPIAALQIKDPGTGQWKWAKPMDNSLTVNAGDCLSILTGNYIKSTIHRVAVPPPDQRSYERLGVIYFSRPPPPMRLNTIDSPVLQRAGCGTNSFEESGAVPTAGEFQVQKELWQKDTSPGKVGKEILPGFKGMTYT